MGEPMSGEEYRRYAAECLQAAELVQDQASRGKLVDMAAAWLRLAEQAEKNSQTVIVYEAPYITERAKP